MKRLCIFLVLILSASFALGQVKTKTHVDKGTNTLWIEPVHYSWGGGKIIGFNLKIEPYIGQKLNKEKKFFRVALTPSGSIGKQICCRANILFVVDGKETLIKDVGMSYSQGIFGPNGVLLDTEVDESLIRSIAGAKEVWVTMFGGQTRGSAQLGADQIGTFKDMVSVYDTLEPLSAASPASDTTATKAQ